MHTLFIQEQAMFNIKEIDAAELAQWVSDTSHQLRVIDVRQPKKSRWAQCRRPNTSTALAAREAQ